MQPARILSHWLPSSLYLLSKVSSLARAVRTGLLLVPSSAQFSSLGAHGVNSFRRVGPTTPSLFLSRWFGTREELLPLVAPLIVTLESRNRI